MSQIFTVSLSHQPSHQKWGDKQGVTYHEHGAIFHLDPQTPLKTSQELLDIQKSARKLAALKLPSIKLDGDWNLEQQWHFWQGINTPKQMPNIEFANLSDSDKKQLDARIKVISWSKQLINQTPEELSPLKLATDAGEFITQLNPEAVSYSIISGKALEEAGLVGIYNVGRGSDREPALLEIDYCPKGCENQPPAAALVGKGITFDSGGYSLKSTLGMLHMKCDMGGAATVTGALGLAIASGLNKRVKLFLACAENLVSGHAYKLSDILKYKNGVSVEVVNTDAEGRLVLADGLILADESEAPVIINAATLTGAACVALGDRYNALFTMNDAMADQLQIIAKQEFDPIWRLPLEPFHQDNCPSDYANTANSKATPGGGIGGASNAAGFLSRFVNYEQKQWAHFDLSACFQDSGGALHSAGATGSGIRTIARYLCQL